MKQCTSCKIIKSISDFYLSKRKNRKPEYYSKCKLCWSKQQHNRYLTPLGRAEVCWNSILQRVEDRRNRNPTYKNIKLKISREEFIKFYIPNYNKFTSNNPNSIATIDRINNDGHYELGNLQIISKKENSQKRPNNKLFHSPNGFSWCYICKSYKTVINFHKSKYRSTGYHNQCKECAKIKRSH